ncbi:Sulfurtransferase [Strongyloides ratti]|uniref:Sulfurtransferase n=1 Tax=Strongyloides ratti TaxID=34506 RepID=A0A090MVG9_STRRB|nr:Sulfurtransferase [Strongyloides ratti]CEF62898.1 Sulfurtransferase [Strongyloides ratti]
MYYPDDRVWQNRNKKYSIQNSLPRSIPQNCFIRTVDPNISNQHQTYNTVIDDKTGPTYEDPDTLYDKNNIKRISDIPPPLPPTANIESLQRLKRSMLNNSPLDSLQLLKKSSYNKKIYILLIIVFIMSIALAITLTSIVIKLKYQQEINEKGILIKDKEIRKSSDKVKYEVLINGSELLNQITAKNKICIFEVSSDRVDESKNDFRREHIESAKLLYYGNLSHVGVPVHPLQFQRYIRSLGVDDDCHVIIYDKGEIIWSTYAFWIFKLYGHEKISILDGGMIEWKKLQLTSSKYHTESGISNFLFKMGNFKSKWNPKYILTFDDILSNFDYKEYDIVDAQSPEEFNGLDDSDLILGHIRTSKNIPIEEVYEWSIDKWKNSTQLDEIFKKAGLLPSRAIAVYCSNSLRASLIWVALQKMNYNASVYFGSWPEWLIRAPDYLKVIPVGRLKQ